MQIKMAFGRNPWPNRRRDMTILPEIPLPCRRLRDVGWLALPGMFMTGAAEVFIVSHISAQLFSSAMCCESLRDAQDWKYSLKEIESTVLEKWPLCVTVIT